MALVPYVIEQTNRGERSYEDVYKRQEQKKRRCTRKHMD